MIDFIYQAFGEGKELSWYQMLNRAVVIFVIAVVLIRISGRRSFGMRSAFDNTIVILLGSTLSRAVVGVSPFFPTVMAGLGLVVLHRVFAWISVHSHAFGKLIKGEAICLFKDGKFNERNMRRSLISRRDINIGLRSSLHSEDLSEVDQIILERNGEITVLVKKKAGQP
jgi:uncharacterized membrane protein YcaP (DUF421 family)